MADIKRIITKRYLVDNKKLPEPVYQKTVITGYLGVDPTVRLRVTDSGAWFQIWKSTDQTHFFEYEIPIAEGETIVTLCYQKTLRNTKTIIFNNQIWKVSEYLGRHTGLFVATLKLDPKDGYEEPPWITKNVSSDKRFTDEALSRLQSPPKSD